MTPKFKKDLISYLKEYRDNGYSEDLKLLTKLKIPKSHLMRNQDPIQISKDIINDLQDIRIMFSKITGFMSGAECPVAIVFLLGQKENVITNIELIHTENDGCGGMCTVTSDNMAKSMYSLINKGCFVAGIAKISLWDNPVSYGQNTMLQIIGQQGLIFMQLTLRKFDVRMPDCNVKKYIQYSYKIV